MLDYDTEAAIYDDTRGGMARAQAAAAGVAELLPDSARTVVDLAGGTGSVAAALTGGDRRVLVVDASLGMLRRAVSRLPGRAVQGDAGRLPLADGSVDAVTTVWLLHLLPDAAAVDAAIAEISRVLRPGGTYVTTVDKETSHRWLPPDPQRRDAEATVIDAAARHELEVAGRGPFTGVGLGRPGVAAGADPVFRLVAFRRGRRA